MLSKVCNACNIEKPLDMYSKANTCKDGHRNYCKECYRLRKEAWRLKNVERCLARNREWIANNPSRAREMYRKSSAKRTASGKAAITKARCVSKNPELYRAIANHRRRKVRDATPKWVDKGALKNIYLQAQLLKLTVDHIIPINHPEVCGLHIPINLQLLTLKENTMKSNQFNGYISRQTGEKIKRNDY